MRKKSLALGMILPLVTSGVVAAAPSASAAPVASTVKEKGDCDRKADDLTLNAKSVDGDIRLTLTLETTKKLSKHQWKVVLKRTNPGNKTLFKDPNVSGADFAKVKNQNNRREFVDKEDVKNKKGTDVFVATALDRKTGHNCDVKLKFKPKND